MSNFEIYWYNLNFQLFYGWPLIIVNCIIRSGLAGAGQVLTRAVRPVPPMMASPGPDGGQDHRDYALPCSCTLVRLVAAVFGQRGDVKHS